MSTAPTLVPPMGPESAELTAGTRTCRVAAATRKPGLRLHHRGNHDEAIIWEPWISRRVATAMARPRCGFTVGIHCRAELTAITAQSAEPSLRGSMGPR